ncbi:DUF2306 domain-containing protein [Oceanicaulis sp. LC35]|uniref:DUF2306 domain-containing protein n=1 Tax=Oceanicaulis sp. LC35 TaxID=3349635 RepID=UPI003F8466BC
MNIDAFLTAPLHIQIHALAAMGALGLGVVQFSAPKGTIPHRALGYVWVGLMLTVAGTAYFIRETNSGFSLLHLLIPVTVIGVVFLTLHARRGNVARHRTTALVLMIAALGIPGAATLIPGRLMHVVVFGG